MKHLLFELLTLILVVPVILIKDNLVSQLIQGFAKVRNLTSVTACLPIPKSAEYPIPWGMLTLTLTKTWEEMWENENQFSRLNWMDLGGSYSLNFERRSYSILNCNITKPSTSRAKELIYRPSGETCTNTLWGCQLPKPRRQVQRGTWDHTQNRAWCLEFTGVTGPLLDPPRARTICGNVDWTRQTEKITHPTWNCTRVYTCNSSDPEVQRLYPLAKALRWGCACRNYSNVLSDTWSPLNNGRKIWPGIDCIKGRVGSLGLTVWVSSDGTWSTHLRMKDKSKQWTLGLLT